MDYHSVFFVSLLAQTNAVLPSVTYLYNFVHKFHILNISIMKNLILLALMLVKKIKTGMGHYFLGSPHIDYRSISLDMCEPSFHILATSVRKNISYSFIFSLFSVKFHHENNVAHLLLNSFC